MSKNNEKKQTGEKESNPMHYLCLLTIFVFNHPETCFQKDKTIIRFKNKKFYYGNKNK